MNCLQHCTCNITQAGKLEHEMTGHIQFRSVYKSLDQHQRVAAVGKVQWLQKQILINVSISTYMTVTARSTSCDILLSDTLKVREWALSFLFSCVDELRHDRQDAIWTSLLPSRHTDIKLCVLLCKETLKHTHTTCSCKLTITTTGATDLVNIPV